MFLKQKYICHEIKHFIVITKTMWHEHGDTNWTLLLINMEVNVNKTLERIQIIGINGNMNI